MLLNFYDLYLIVSTVILFDLSMLDSVDGFRIPLRTISLIGKENLIVPSSSFPSSSSSIFRKKSLIHRLSSNQGLTETGKSQYILPTLVDRARTIAHICGGGTLCTTSSIQDFQDYPYGSYVDYILDEKGWPVLLLNNQSMHTQNIRRKSAVSLFCMLPRGDESTTAALSRVTLMGTVQNIPSDEITALKFAFILVHPYAEQIADSPKFSLVRIKPEKIYFSGGFGVMSQWINVQDYEAAHPDVLAQDVPSVLSRTNDERQGELLLLCKHYFGIDNVEQVRIQTIDRLGIDVRVKKGNSSP